jgi:hypothetical protein
MHTDPCIRHNHRKPQLHPKRPPGHSQARQAPSHNFAYPVQYTRFPPRSQTREPPVLPAPSAEPGPVARARSSHHGSALPPASLGTSTTHFPATTKAHSHVLTGSQNWMLCIRRPAPRNGHPAARNRRYMGDRRSPSPSGHITLDIRVILAHLFGPKCGDDHPYITRYVIVWPNNNMSACQATRPRGALSFTGPLEFTAPAHVAVGS